MRITANRLEARLAFINRLLARPAISYTGPVANPGHLYLSASPYGYEVMEIVNTSGGVRVLFEAMPARMMYAVLGAFLEGIRVRGTVDEAYAANCRI